MLGWFQKVSLAIKNPKNTKKTKKKFVPADAQFLSPLMPYPAHIKNNFKQDQKIFFDKKYFFDPPKPQGTTCAKSVFISRNQEVP